MLVAERDAWIAGQVDSKAPRAGALGHEADIGKRRLITVAEFAAGSLLAIIQSGIDIDRIGEASIASLRGTGALARHLIRDPKLLPPVLQPPKILALALNMCTWVLLHHFLRWPNSGYALTINNNHAINYGWRRDGVDVLCFIKLHSLAFSLYHANLHIFTHKRACVKGKASIFEGKFVRGAQRL